MNLLKLLPFVVKAVAGVNVKDEMKASTDVMDRPFCLSGRFIGLVMTTLFGGLAVKTGIDLGASIENVTELASLIYDNNELLGEVGLMMAGMARGIMGVIQRKK